MQLHEDDPVQMMLTHVDYLESMSRCLEMVAVTLRDDDRQTAADAIMQTVRDQRFQAMLLRGHLAAW